MNNNSRCNGSSLQTFTPLIEVFTKMFIYSKGEIDIQWLDLSSFIVPFSLHSAAYDEEKSLLMSQKSLEKRFGQSPVFIAATFMEQGGIPPTTNPATLLKEAIHVISCGYEDKSEWGKEVRNYDITMASIYIESGSSTDWPLAMNFRRQNIRGMFSMMKKCR